MKLLVDMFACQTHSRMRGIGRYSLSLICEMAKLRGINEMAVLGDALYLESFDELRQQFIRLLPPGAFLPYYHEPLKYAQKQNMESYYQIAETLIEQAYRVVGPDIVLTPSLFDSWADGEQGRVSLPDKKSPFQPRAVILYDLIPYIFHEVYLDPDPYIHKWFLKRMDLLKKFDLILSISEATRQDAVSILGIDPNRVVNISGAASSHFRKLELSDREKQEWLQRLGISRPFVLYIGGNDFRKNMDGALRAFALLPREITTSHQLVLNDIGEESVFRIKARSLGLEDADLVVFKRRSDEELVALYNLCKLFIFPSLYEGFGLPILEAMMCGAPVIASNNSSLPEVVGRTDALFDASSIQKITASIYKALKDDGFRADLAAYGPVRARQFSWQNTAHRAWDAIESVHGLNQFAVPREISGLSGQPRLHLAHVSPLPPQKSGVAEYSAALLPYLARYFKIDLFTEPGLKVSDTAIKENFPIFPWTELNARRDSYDAVLYQMGNSELHIPMLDLLQEIPGIVVSHDFFYSNLPFVKEVRTGELGQFLKELDYSHGLRGVIDYYKRGVELARWEWPINWRLLKNAQELIIHSKHQNELIQRFYGHGWRPKPIIINHFRKSPQTLANSDKQAMRKELGIPSDAFIYCSFGFLAPTKMNILTIRAFSQIHMTSEGEIMLVFVGEMDNSSEYGINLLKIRQELQLTKKIRITGYVNKTEYEKYLNCANVAIQLRTDSRGETSGALLDCMAYGLPTIINSHGSFNDYNSEVVVKISESPDVQELTQAMLRLQTDSAFRLERGKRARNLVAEKHDPQKAAAAYAEVIVRAARTNEAQLFSPLVDSILGLGSPLSLQQSSAKFSAAHLTLRCQPRIFLDVTSLQNDELREEDVQTATQLITELFSITDKAIHIELVYVVGGCWLRAGRIVERIFDLPKFSLGGDLPIIIQPGDVLLLIDASLTATIQPPEILENIRQKGGRITALGDRFIEGLLTLSALECDIFICSSRKIAEKLKAAVIGKHIHLRRSLDIFFPKSDVQFIGCDENIDRGDAKVGRTGTTGYIVASTFKTPESVSWIMNLILGDQSESSLFHLAVDTGGHDKPLQGVQNNQLDIDGEVIAVVNRKVSIPRSKGFSIVVEEKASDGISAALLSNNYKLPYHYNMLLDLAPSGGRVVDLGAHIGTFSLYAATNGYEVISVEASPRNAALLNASMLRNGFEKMKIVSAAVSDHLGSLVFFEDGPRGAIANPIMNDYRAVTVPAVTVDSLLSDFDLEHVDLIKMDIEGSEVKAIQGMLGLLSSEKAPCLLFESNGHTLNFFGMSPRDLISSLEAFDYKCYHFYAGKLFPISADDIQLECVADCLAAKNLPDNFAEKWKIAAPMSLEERISVVLGEMSFHNPDVRAYVGRILKNADQVLVEDYRISKALDGLKHDPEENVRNSVVWWR
jgi:FkbM family methyltransferase